eukprot:g48462.t1
MQNSAQHWTLLGGVTEIRVATTLLARRGSYSMAGLVLSVVINFQVMLMDSGSINAGVYMQQDLDNIQAWADKWQVMFALSPGLAPGRTLRSITGNVTTNGNTSPGNFEAIGATGGPLSSAEDEAIIQEPAAGPVPFALTEAALNIAEIKEPLQIHRQIVIQPVRKVLILQVSLLASPHSTIRNVSRQAPANHSPPAALTQGIAQKEEIRPGMSGLFVEQTAPTISSYLKRFTEEQKAKVLMQDRVNGREKEQKGTDLEKEKGRDQASAHDRLSACSVVKTEFHVKNVPEKGSRSSQSPKRFKGGVAEEFEKISKAEMRHKFGYDEEEVEEHDKDYPAKNQKEYGYEDELKYRSKLIASKTQERYDEEDEEEEEDDDNDRPRKREEINFFKHITISKEKFREVEEVEEEEELMPEKFKKEERFLSKKPDGNRYREVSPVKALKYKAGRAESPPPPRKSSDSKEQEVAAAQEESTPVLKPTHRPTEVTLKMDSLQFGDDSLGSANVLTHERRLCRDLVHKPKKDQEFRSIFQHIQMAQSRRSPSELFAQHIVTLVHHVKGYLLSLAPTEHYFKSAGVTLNERFTMYQRRTAEQEVPRQKSPEIHRRIDISPSALKKRMHFRDEIKSQKESSYKGEGKLKDEPDDLRLDIEHRRKYKSKEGEHKKDSSKDSRDSSHSRERSKEKSGKIPKAYKESKKHSSNVYVPGLVKFLVKQARKMLEKVSKSGSICGERKTVNMLSRIQLFRIGQLQFRIRGRGYGRGAFPGPSNSSNPGNPTFQKRPREEDWDPEYTPKSKKYYLHDDREGDGDNYWANKRGRGTFQRGRGRFLYKKSNTSPKWTHDKYQGSGQEGVEEEEEEEEDDGQVGNIASQEDKKLGTMEQ